MTSEADARRMSEARAHIAAALAVLAHADNRLNCFYGSFVSAPSLAAEYEALAGALAALAFAVNSETTAKAGQAGI